MGRIVRSETRGQDEQCYDSHVVHARFLSDACEAARRSVQALMLLICGTLAFRELWLLMTFPGDDHSWSFIAAMVVAATVPITIWWRQLSRSRCAGTAELFATTAAAGVGLGLLARFGMKAGFLLTWPYQGPFAFEGTVFYLTAYVIAGVGSSLLALSSLLLDSHFFAPAVRGLLWRIARWGVPGLAIASLIVGSQYHFALP